MYSYAFNSFSKISY